MTNFNYLNTVNPKHTDTQSRTVMANRLRKAEGRWFKPDYKQVATVGPLKPRAS